MTATEPPDTDSSSRNRRRGNPGGLVRLRYYLPYTWRLVVLHRPGPLIYGIALTDRCNLRYRGCTVANTGRPPMTWAALLAALHDAHERGFREVYFSGGEPTLWRDGGHGLDDAIEAARRAGFFPVHVYTNGTRGLPRAADLVWVSIDGLPDVYERRRGRHFDLVEQVVRAGGPPRVAVMYVIDRNTACGVESFLRWVRDTAFPVVGVMFYFHTPYYGRDALYLDRAERAPLIDRLLECIAAGLPVLNSRAGLTALGRATGPAGSRSPPCWTSTGSPSAAGPGTTCAPTAVTPPARSSPNSPGRGPPPSGPCCATGDSDQPAGRP
jgi:hypothetical protein